MTNRGWLLGKRGKLEMLGGSAAGDAGVTVSGEPSDGVTEPRSAIRNNGPASLAALMDIAEDETSDGWAGAVADRSSSMVAAFDAPAREVINGEVINTGVPPTTGGLTAASIDGAEATDCCVTSSPMAVDETTVVDASSHANCVRRQIRRLDNRLDNDGGKSLQR